MGENRDRESKEQTLHQIPDAAVEALARSMYGEAEYEALGEDSQVKDGYRKRARALLVIACDAAAEARGKSNAPNASLPGNPD
jgi:hypothetical protein